MTRCEKIANALDTAFANARDCHRAIVNGVKGSEEAIRLCDKLTKKDIEYLNTRGYGVGLGRIRSGGQFLRLQSDDNRNDTE